MVRLNDPTYAAGQSKCEPYREDPSAQPPEAKSYAQAPPAQMLFLADLASGKLVERVFDGGLGGKFPHYEGSVTVHGASKPAPVCLHTTP